MYGIAWTMGGSVSSSSSSSSSSLRYVSHLPSQLKQKDAAWKEKMQSQADELAILRSGAGRVDQLEAKLKRRNAELQDLQQLRDHVQEVEARNLELEDQNGTLQAENSKIPALNRQLQAYRDKLTVRACVRACVRAYVHAFVCACV